MDVNQATPPRKLRGLGRSLSVEKTPPQALQCEAKPHNAIEDDSENSALEQGKTLKAFSFTERYMSPTDRILSPISKCLLAQNRKIGMLWPSTRTPPKNLDCCFQDAGSFQI